MEEQNKTPIIHHTRQGVLFAKPRDILKSGNAQEELKKIRKSKLFKSINKKRKV